MTQKQIIAAVVDGTLFGEIECDIRVPSELRAHFAEMQPIFKNAMVTRDDIGPFMQQYAVDHDIMSTPRRMLVGSYRGDKILLITDLLQWYLAHGIVVDHVYQVIERERNPCFQHFGESVSAARRAGDTDPNKAIIADTMKLLGNSAYGKTVTNVDRHRDTKCCTEVSTSQFINSNRFRQLDVITEDTYEVAVNKSVVRHNLPLHIGFYVYQLAKKRMLELYYDFIDRYVDRSLFQYCEMDTDTAYIVLAGKASTISSHQSIASISSSTDRNDCRLNVVTSIMVTTSIPDSLDAHGPNRVALHIRRSTSGLQDYSKLSGAATVSSDYVVKRIMVLVPPISAPRRA